MCRCRMSYKIETIETELWHRIMDDLRGAGFTEIYFYDGMDAGIDYSRYDLKSLADGELIVFEWYNWTEGEVTGTAPRLEALREKYGLPEISEVEG